jgi:uncharacterized membrane protein YphA (DoxX/SURF4 family)
MGNTAPVRLQLVPARLAAGAYILHSGIEKFGAGDETAGFLHDTASNSYPFLRRLKPAQFLRLVALGEVAVGAALVLPVVPPAVAGSLLTGFSSALLGVYARTPGLRRPGSIWPTHEGIGMAKDVWMLGIGLSLLAESVGDGSGADNT